MDTFEMVTFEGGRWMVMARVLGTGCEYALVVNIATDEAPVVNLGPVGAEPQALWRRAGYDRQAFVEAMTELINRVSAEMAAEEGEEAPKPVRLT